MEKINLLILGIAITEYKNDAISRFEYFCNAYGLKYKLIGIGKSWSGGEIFSDPGGGQKINETLLMLEKLDNQLVLICDTFDLFPLAHENEIIDKFNKLHKPDHVIISSEIYCWPNTNLANYYPVINNKYKYLNSGCIMGYRNDIYDLIKNSNIKDSDDDQLYFTTKYLSGSKIIIDHNCELFQTLNGSSQDITFYKNRCFNMYTKTFPAIIHGNGASKIFLNSLENYIETNPGKNHCHTLRNEYGLEKEPKIFFALYIDTGTPMISLKTFFENFQKIKYENKVVFVYDKNDNGDVENFIESEYTYVTFVKGYVFKDFVESDCDYYFLLEQQCILTKPDVIHELLFYMETDTPKQIISPMLVKNNSAYSNFWGELSKTGYYARSFDYLDIIEYKKIGIWNVPYVFGAILFSRNVLTKWDNHKYKKFENDVDMDLCYNLRRNFLFTYVTNFNVYGYLTE